jgi:CDP-2,3-bis-(O-geranylgeranyl)-sn-glycerol synthase
MDFGKSFHGKPILGPHKTWRGILSGVFVATLTFWIQQRLAADTSWAHSLTSSIDYAHLPTLIVGPLFGIGALGGDALKSFFKRRRGMTAGAAWVPFDQLDYIIGGVVATAPFATLSLAQYAWLITLWVAIHIVSTWTGWLLHLKDSPI